MKKLSIFMAAALALTGLGSCSPDREPQYQDPTEFVLNVPVLQDQYIELTAGNTLDLVTSQPDYGYSAVANYSAEMSFTSDFEEYVEISPIDAHMARMTFNQEAVAIAVCELLGLEDEDSYHSAFPDGMPYMKLYFRAVCQINGVEGSLIRSNVVSYNHVKPYFAVAVPGYIYLIGDISGWNEPSEGNAAVLADWRLFEPDYAIGSKVYRGTFTLAPNNEFRFYTALTGWDGGDSYGTGADDVTLQYPEFTGDESFTAPVVKGKGKYQFPNLAAGEVTIEVNMSDENNMTVTFYPGDEAPALEQYVYMVGNNGGWATPSPENYADWKLVDADGSGVYEATFEFGDFTNDNGELKDGGTLYCRFYKNPNGWGNADWAANEPDGVTTEAASGQAYPTVVGEGCFTIADIPNRTLNVILNTNTSEVTFTY